MSGSSSKRWFWAALAALMLTFAALSHGCGGLDCMRNSDCDSALECREGTCQVPLSKLPSSDAGIGQAGQSGTSSPTDGGP